MTPPRILIISFSNISADARVLRQVSHFAARYDVTTFGYGPSPDTRVQHIQIDDSHKIHKWTRRELILRQFRRMYWEQSAIRQAQADLTPLTRFDAILANDIDTVGLALSLDPVHGVHADIHEYSPRQNEELLIWRVFEGPYMKWMCRRFLPRATSMTTVGQGLADEYRRIFGLDSQIVTNATPYADFDVKPVGTPIRLVHSGASLRNRRLETLVDAVAATSTEVSLDLYLMGNDPKYVEELRARASDRVRVLDPLPYSQLIGRLNQYDVGIHVIAPTNFNNRWSLPNKFFDYVQARLGLIIGPSVEMQRLLEGHGLGAVSADFGAPALAKVLDSLNPEQVQSWKTNSAASAHALSAETQIVVWDNAICKLLADGSS